MGLVAQPVFRTPDMRSLIVICLVTLAIVFVQAKKGKGKGGKPGKTESSGLCLSERNMMVICHAGSDLGEKANAALEVCSSTNAETRAKKPKGKPSKCPTFATIVDTAKKTYAGEICVFKELSWLDDDMTTYNELIKADIETLPPKISEALKGDKFDKCVSKAKKKMMNLAKQCQSRYTEQEISQLKRLGNAVAHTECFKATFKIACAAYVKTNLSSMFGDIMAEIN